MLFTAFVKTSCDDQFAAVLVSRAYPTAPQPKIPTSSCPCWAVPGNGGVCPNITIPIYLSTISLPLGESWSQCIDPASE